MPRPLPALALLAAFAVPAWPAEVLILSPRSSQPVFGDVEVAFRVLSVEPIRSATIRLDGRVVGTLTAEPWRLTVDVGSDNRDRVFAVEVLDATGAVDSDTVTTRAVAVDSAVELGLQQLFVSVTRNGERTLDFTEDAFEVLDQGEPQSIVTFEAGDSPLTAVVLIDASFSMRGSRLAAAVAGARRFISDLRDLDLVKVVLFSDRTLYATEFSNDEQRLDAPMAGVEAAHGTAINDHLYLALKALDTTAGRQVIVLLSDGVDVESVLEIEAVQWKARRTQPLIYWIRPGAVDPQRFNFFSQWRDPEGHRRNILGLEELVRESGGTIFDIAEIDEAPRTFADIAAELRQQYVIGYYPTRDTGDGAFHRVEVKVAGGRARTRRGYYDVEN